ncbi:copper chaperone PCu(A)C [Streptomyces lunaelactis]|uniref:copper chaperone PCu(A)C n=1 Tax=Streptomyces lunaelactis TaxID=1535768 RepID=UPI001584C624|nr:copper chaperone PCu(A)C [Streptomyces lunaelactis]NUK03647.1 copper chaperone PCu(A)C [Streptomyces lunaelactis]NUK14884.1 copper chaperone PCu(A)C [Streptomyces lunaelactis]NUK36915.1 copper chaperone PCu(A)C [Streptomyces lunaelactis]NUK43554.1 copper chaperone PCu(A)C [Streptomyces lunaelactis]NUK53231.1 copper chaperone PCu(A)C [Streptomyces lunaelactis]
MSRSTALAAVVALSGGLALAGCSSGSEPGSPELKVSGAFMPQPVNSEMASGFLTVRNSGGTADRLTSVTSDLSDDITIHESKNQTMQEVKAFDVPADGKLDLERGGNHIMFMRLKQKPEQGEKVTVELRFEKSGPIKVELPVEAPTHNPKH